MAAKARAQITLTVQIDIESVWWYYKLQSSTAAKPARPTANPPEGWTLTEPGYAEGSTNTLYFVELTVFTDGSFQYTDVSVDSSYEAAKAAWNKAHAAQQAATDAQETAQAAQAAAAEARVHTGSEPPAAPVPEGKIWVDTGENPSVIRRWLGLDAAPDRDYGGEVSGSFVETPAGTASFDSLTSAFSPVQSGSGTPRPENVRPVSGRTAVTLTRCGKNLLNPTVAAGAYQRYASTGSDGRISVKNTASSRVYPVTTWVTLPAGTYTASCTLNISGDIEMYLQKSSGDYSTQIHNRSQTAITLKEATTVRMLFVAAAGADFTAAVQLEAGSSATEYAPYAGDAYTADFGQTVYGGTMNWRTGELTVEWGSVRFMPTSLAAYGTAGYRRATMGGISPKAAEKDDYSLCDRFRRWYAYNADDEYCYISNTAAFVFSNRWSTLEEAQAWFSENPTTIVYKLAEPYTLQLKIPDIAPIAGPNALYGDGTVSVSYTASGWETVNDTAEIRTILGEAALGADSARRQAEEVAENLERRVRLDSAGLHVGDSATANELLLQSGAIHFVIGGMRAGTIAADYHRFGGMEIRTPSVGGIVIQAAQ